MRSISLRMLNDTGEALYHRKIIKDTWLDEHMEDRQSFAWLAKLSCQGAFVFLEHDPTPFPIDAHAVGAPTVIEEISRDVSDEELWRMYLARAPPNANALVRARSVKQNPRGSIYAEVVQYYRIEDATWRRSQRLSQMSHSLREWWETV